MTKLFQIEEIQFQKIVNKILKFVEIVCWFQLQVGGVERGQVS